MTLTIRDAVPGDAGRIVQFIADLAEYEKLSHEAVATRDDILRHLFGPNPRVFCEIAEWEGAPVGFALWYYTFSTFQGRHGIWLEDLYIDKDKRGFGIGKALLVNLARRCVREDLGRFEWNVLDWNTPSIEFYRSQGAVIVEEWNRCRVSGAALQKLGQA